MPAWARWTALAVLGILVAAAVSVAASRLTSQKIGLASEPLSAGERLAPAKVGQPAAPAEPKPGGQQGNHPPQPPPATTTGGTTTATTTAAPPAPATVPGPEGEAGGEADD